MDNYGWKVVGHTEVKSRANGGGWKYNRNVLHAKTGMQVDALQTISSLKVRRENHSPVTSPFFDCPRLIYHPESRPPPPRLEIRSRRMKNAGMQIPLIFATAAAPFIHLFAGNMGKIPRKMIWKELLLREPRRSNSL